ncbi:GLPGLI family protein, partial [uncultured Duncaniella sp.]
RGRNWTAWYTEEIPITDGPWKFGGLPGLILKVEDDKKEHIMEALQVRKHDADLSYFIRSFLIKTDREKFNEMYKEYKTNAGSFLSGSPNMPTKADGSPAIGNKRLFFNPLELE